MWSTTVVAHLPQRRCVVHSEMDKNNNKETLTAL